MLVQADKVFLTASPISELVWSPRKGLGLKCADSSSVEHRTSLWWNTESFNVIATGPECNGIGEIFNNGVSTEDPSQYVPSSSNIDDIHVSTPGSIVGVVPACCTMTQEQNSTNDVCEASCEEMERLPVRNEESVAQANIKENITKETKADEPYSGNSKRNNDSTIYATKKVYSQGGGNDKSTRSSFSSPVEMDLDCDKANKGNLSVCMDGDEKPDGHDPDPVKGSDLMCNLSSNPSSYLQYADSKHSEKVLDEVNVNIQIHPQLTYFYPQVDRRLSSGNALDSSFTKTLASCGGKVAGFTIQEPLDNAGNDTQNEPFAPRRTLESSDKEEERRRKKGKEKIDGYQEHVVVCANKEGSHASDYLKDKNGSHESVRSSSSKEFSTGKRERCFESESSCKKLKRLENEPAFSGTLVKQDSSFLNWISGFTKVLPCSVEADLCTAIVPKMSQSKPKELCAPFFFKKGGDLPYDNVGFHSFTQTLHHSILKTTKMLIGDVDDQHNPIYMHELQKPNKPSTSAFGATYRISANLNLGKSVPLAAFRLDQYRPEELPPHAGTTGRDFNVQGKQLYTGFDNHGLCNFGSSSSSFRIASMDPENTEAGKPDSGLHSSNVMVVSSGNEYRGSFWITRLCPRPIIPSSTGQINEVVTSATATQHRDRNLLAPTLQKETFLLEGTKCSENVHIAPDGALKDTVRNEEHSLNRTESSSKGVTFDKKPKAKLNPILPSKRIKKMEPITSVFAKRLDAFKHIKSPNIINDVLLGSTCFFCGQTGHSMKDCSQVIGTKLERFQKNIKSFRGSKDSACLCICCFQLTHWAVACPYSSTKVNAPGGTSPYITEIKFEEAKEAIEYPSLRETSHSEYTKNVVMHTLGVEEIEPSDTKEINDFPGEYDYKGKTILNPSVHSKGRGQVTPVYSFAKTKMLRKTNIFDGIKYLRLSRSDIARLMKTPIPNLSLDGFFLRVRLGKEETPEGSGYQVACISGLTHDKFIGTTKHHIPVDIGGFKCLLDSRFVSNNDFLEDELDAWWSMLSRGGTRPPTEDDLARKIAERKKFGI